MGFSLFLHSFSLVVPICGSSESGFVITLSLYFFLFCFLLFCFAFAFRVSHGFFCVFLFFCFFVFWAFFECWTLLVEQWFFYHASRVSVELIHSGVELDLGFVAAMITVTAS